MADSISAIPQQPQLGRLAQFLRFLETQNAPEFLPKQLDVMGLMAKLALPQASTVENLSYGNYPFTMPPAGTGAAIPQVKTGRKPEVADLVGMLGGVPGVGAVSDVTTKLSNEAADAIVRAITRNPEATATGVIRETSMPFMQAVAPRTPGLLETPAKSELGFYSALEQATMPLQNKGTGAQFLAQIEKTAGVKPEEVKWTGLDEFLRSRQNVTKQEVQDYLAANRVNLQEVRLGDTPFSAQAFNERFSRNGIGYTMEETPNGPVFYLNGRQIDYSMVPEQMQATLENSVVSNTKFSKYTLPGGENYREILLTLPTSGSGGKRVRVYTQDGTSAVQVMSDADIQRMAESGRRRFEVLDEVNPKGTFQSSHFDQPNILAHMRVNDRVVDGKKTLFIEEIQSDWHQAGRKKGYGPQTETTHEAYYTTPDGQRVSLGFGKTQEEAAAAVDPGWQGIVDVKFDTQTKKVGEGVPDAPFKTSWHELTLKRAIQEASEKGYDQIAFTTGKTQAERYDLSKQVDSLLYSKNPDGTYRVSAQIQGRGQMMGEAIPEADLADYVGKEVAEKMAKGTGKQTQVSGEYDPISMTSSTKYMTELSGEGLKVGGEGMKGFYDQILPKTLDKLGKKFDAKVGKTEMDGVEVWAMNITPKMRESVLTKGQPLFAATPAIPAVGLLGDEGE